MKKGVVQVCEIEYSSGCWFFCCFPLEVKHILPKERAMENVIQVKVVDRCTCNEGEHEYHSCAYACEIYEDFDPEHCNCCEFCSTQCMMDV